MRHRVIAMRHRVITMRLRVIAMRHRVITMRLRVIAMRHRVILSLSKDGRATHGHLMPILRQAQDDMVAGSG